MKALSITMLAALGLAGGAANAQTLGERLAKNACAQCHSFGKGEPAGVGPNLHGLLGRPAGSVAGFEYSAPFQKALKGQPWDRALLERWLVDAQAVAPGNGMSYFEDDPAKRAALIQYLESLK